MKTMEEMARTLLLAAEEYGLLETLLGMFGNSLDVRIILKEKSYAEKLEALDLSVRSLNGLKRGGAVTVGDVMDLIGGGSLAYVRNLGKKSIMEIKGALLAYAYEQMTEKEKENFLKDLLRRNGNLSSAGFHGKME